MKWWEFLPNEKGEHVGVLVGLSLFVSLLSLTVMVLALKKTTRLLRKSLMNSLPLESQHRWEVLSEEILVRFLPEGLYSSARQYMLGEISEEELVGIFNTVQGRRASNALKSLVQTRLGEKNGEA